MKILVCIKQVPGTMSVDVDPVTGALKRDGVESKMNPYDLYAVEAALRIAADYSGTVHALTMGPNQACAVLEEAMYMGATSGTIVSDRAFAGADVLATAYTLAQAIKKIGSIDLIICGKQTTDGDTAQVGAELSEFLGLPYMSNVLEIKNIVDGRIHVVSDQEQFKIESEITLPCVLSMDSEINTPRLPSYRMKKVLQPVNIKLLTLSDLDDTNPKNYGMNGSPTQVEQIFTPINDMPHLVLQDSAENNALMLLKLLKEQKLL